MTQGDLPRKIGFWGAVAIQVGIIIGSGIFRTPPQIAQGLDAPWLILVLWLAGGLASLLGAWTYAELATMHPESGGVYVFLREAYGRCTAFVFGWSYMLLSKPLAAAGIAVVFAEHLNQLLGTHWDPRAATVALLIVLTAINVRGVRLSTGLAGVLTGLKFAVLLGIVALPLVRHVGSLANLAGVEALPPVPPEAVRTPTLLEALVPVMAAIMWTYDGWSDVGAIAGEVKSPARNLPRVYALGTIATTALYLLVNAAFIAVIPLREMATMNTVAPAMFERLLGPAAGVAAALLVLVSTSGSTHGSVMTGARITYQQARDGLLFRFLAGVHPRWETPWIALIVQLGLSILAAVFVETFESLAGGFVFTMWVWYGLAAGAIFILRRTQPDHPRPYRCWGYPVVPAVFILTAVGMTALAIHADPAQTLAWIGVMALGVPVYFWWRRLFPAPGARG
jgi:basic amino acid/polyamine antiporter, APA family